MAFLVAERRSPSCGASQENQTCRHLAGAVDFVVAAAAAAALATAAALVGVARLFVSVADGAFVAERMGYN